MKSLKGAANQTLEKQLSTFKTMIKQCQYICSILDIVDQKFKQQNINYYIAGGCIAQIIWNTMTIENELEYGIHAINILYFDDSNLSLNAEKETQQQIEKCFQEYNIVPILPVVVKNEARVHLWYKEVFGQSIDAFGSLEDAINALMPTTATAIGIKKCDHHHHQQQYSPQYHHSQQQQSVVQPSNHFQEETYSNLQVYAPFGLQDMFSMTLRPNRTLIQREVYDEKVAKWTEKWPRLKALPW